MKEEHINKLIEKYKEGLTSKNEEELLFNNIPENNDRLQQTASFIEAKRIKVPKNLNAKLWDSFDEKISKKKSNSIYKWSAVASVAVLLTFYLNYNYEKKEELKKRALLEEAKSMFAETKKPLKMNKILFEDETLIVYTKIEN